MNKTYTGYKIIYETYIPSSLFGRLNALIGKIRISTGSGQLYKTTNKRGYPVQLQD